MVNPLERQTYFSYCTFFILTENTNSTFSIMIFLIIFSLEVMKNSSSIEGHTNGIKANSRQEIYYLIKASVVLRQVSKFHKHPVLSFFPSSILIRTLLLLMLKRQTNNIMFLSRKKVKD